MRGWSPTALYLLAGLGPGWQIELDTGVAVRCRHRDGSDLVVGFRRQRDVVTIEVRGPTLELERAVRDWFVGTSAIDAILRWQTRRMGVAPRT